MARADSVWTSTVAGDWEAADLVKTDKVLAQVLQNIEHLAQTHNHGRSAYAAAVLADAPLGYWRLGEANGVSAEDLGSGTAAPGTYTGGYTLAQAGALAGDSDYAAAFNGTTGYVDLGTPAKLNVTGAWTLEAWAYPTAAPQNSGVIARAYVSRVQYEIGFSFDEVSANSVLKGGFYNGNWQLATDPAGNIPLNAWVHIVVTWNGTILRLYKNGSQVATNTPGSACLAEANPFVIARRHDLAGTKPYFPGRVDEAAIYGATLSAERIAIHYNLGLASVLALGAPLTNNESEEIMFRLGAV